MLYTLLELPVTLRDEDIQGMFGKSVAGRIYESIKAEAQKEVENYISISFIRCIFHHAHLTIIITIIIMTKRRRMTGRIYITYNARKE